MKGKFQLCKDSCVRATGAGDVRLLLLRMPKVSSKCIFSRLPPTEVLSRVNFSASVITCILLFFMTTDSILLFYGYPDGGCEISAARQCLILFVQETVYDLLPVFFGQRCEKCRISCDTHYQIRISFRVFVCF